MSAAAERAARDGVLGPRAEDLPMGWSRREVLTHDLAAAVEVWDGHSSHMAERMATNPAVAAHFERAQDMADAARALLADIRAHREDTTLCPPSRTPRPRPPANAWPWPWPRYTRRPP